MNPLYTQVIAAVIRHTLAAFGVAGAVSDDEISRLLGALAVVVSIGWSVWQKYQAAQRVEPPPPPPALPVLKYGKRDR
jgi:hypothetical protein